MPSTKPFSWSSLRSTNKIPASRWGHTQLVESSQRIRTKVTGSSQKFRSHSYPTERATQVSQKSSSLWQSWKNLSVSSRLAIGFVFAIVGSSGLMISNYLEQRMPSSDDQLVNSTAADHRKPRLFGVRVIEKQS